MAVGDPPSPLAGNSYFAAAQAVAVELGVPFTANNRIALVSWIAAEQPGGANNPMNTTLRRQGSTPLMVPGQAQCVNYPNCVQNYPGWASGVSANVDTLKGYPSIVQSLRNDAPPDQTASAIINSRWGTGPQLAQVVRQASTDPVYWNTIASRTISGSTVDAGNVPAGADIGQAVPGGVLFAGPPTGSECRPVISAPLVGTVFNSCQARAILGGLLVGAGGLVMLVGLGFVVFGRSGASRVAGIVGGPLGAAAGARAATTRTEAPLTAQDTEDLNTELVAKRQEAEGQPERNRQLRRDYRRGRTVEGASRRRPGTRTV